jgi:hypothetical protein
MFALAASVSRLGACSDSSIRRQAWATFTACCSIRLGWSGLQRRQGRKPAVSASARVAWNCTLCGRGRRAAHDGRQYTPVVLTE